MRTTQKQRIIIGTLCAVVIGLAVGYAVLSQTLTVNGTGSIASDFNVMFTNITAGAMNSATSVNAQITDSTTAVFTVDLQKPGANGIYNVTVENRGKINAYVKSISGLEESNAADPTDVTFEVIGIDVGDKLPVTTGNTKTFQVKVNWDAEATTIPDAQKDLTLVIEFEQDTGA